MEQTDIDTLVAAYTDYFRALSDWKVLTKDIEAKATGCGPIYELGSIIDVPGQSIAIADMRAIAYATPHYHKDETEIYFVLEGTGRVVVGGEITALNKGDVVVTPPNTAHYVIPTEDLVLAVLNTPPFDPANNVDLTKSKPEVGFDEDLFRSLVKLA